MKWNLLCFLAAVYIGYCFVDDFDPSVLRDKNVVITGASMGIGEQMAYVYAKLGANVIITARSESRLIKVIERCKELGHKDGRYVYHVANMADMDATKSLIQAANDQLGGIDYLVLNHIIPAPLGMWSGDERNLTSLHDIIDINFRSYVHLASHALPSLQQRNGSIVVVSSVAGRVSQPFVTAYSASKFALDGFFNGFREELKMKNIDVSVTICIIGFVGTDNAFSLLKQFGAEYLLSVLHAASPDDVATAIVRGGALRKNDVFYPYMEAKFAVLLNNVAPSLFYKLTQILYAR